MFGVKHFPSRGQLFLFLQLQLSSISAVLFKTFILWLFITDFMFCRFTDFCRNIFVKRWIKPYDFSLMLTMFLMVSVWVYMLVSYCIQIAANYFHSVLLILWMFQWRIGLIDDIPIPSERCYKLQLMDKIDQVIKRMRWKACFIQTEARIRKKPGLKLLNCPQKIKEMVHTLLIWGC